MQKIFRLFLLSLLNVCACAWAAGAEETVGRFDLRYTLKPELIKTPQGVDTAWDDVHAVAALQGIVNRDAPRLYVIFVNDYGRNIDEFWWDEYAKPGQWLDGKKTKDYPDIVSLVEAYRPFIQGVVAYDGNVAATSNVASAVAGAENLLPLRYDADPHSLYGRLVLSGPKLPVKRWLVKADGAPLFTGKGVIPGTQRVSTGSAKNDAYVWMIENYVKPGKLNTAYGAYYIDQYWKKNPAGTVRNHHTLSNHDFFIAQKAFFFDLSPWGDEAPVDDRAQTPGTDLKTMQELFRLMWTQNGRGKVFAHLGGFPPWAFKYTTFGQAGGGHEPVATEWEYARILSAYNAYKDADAIGLGALANASFWMHFPLQKQYPQKGAPSLAELRARDLVDAKGKVKIDGRNFVIFYVGDYDASSWLAHAVPEFWADPARGKLPLMWAVSPVLDKRVPHVMHYIRTHASDNDYFTAADNGAGYLLPGMLQAPRAISGLPDGVAQWRAHNEPYYARWGLRHTGFIIDGEAPAMNNKCLDAYADFSPGGIVPQKVPYPASLHGDMPMLKQGWDLVGPSPQEAAAVMLEQIKKREGFPFHWFRTILKSPTWHAQMMEAVQKESPSVTLLDMPTFFELLKLYLQQNPKIGK